MQKKLLLLLTVWRILWAWLSQSWYVPDTVWQSVEVAHTKLWDTGNLTWEWGQGVRLRSAIHPLLYMSVFLPFKLLGIHPTSLIILLPKVLTGIITAASDLAMLNVVKKLESPGTASWFLLLQQTNWFLLYSGSRTVINTFETSLFTFGLLLFPRPKFLAVAAFSVFCRPTLALPFGPLILLFFLQTLVSKGALKCFSYITWGILGSLMSVAIDSLFYGDLTLTPCNFLKFNVLNNLSSFYGENPVFWYLSHALVPILGPLLVPSLLGLPSCPPQVLMPCLATLLPLSLVAHKEMRFIQPIIPLLLISAAKFLNQKLRSNPSLSWLAIISILNIPPAFYLSTVHQRGVMDAVSWLREEESSRSVLVLMPCHSLPLHSHLHLQPLHNIRLLSCEPNLSGVEKYEDEAEQFFRSPLPWLKEHDGNFVKYDTYVMFSSIHADVKGYLTSNGVNKCQDFFHTHLPEGRVGNRVEVWCINR